ncbi:hypothetical protein ACRRTK_009458 [Alexandromys fortis]
MELSFLILFCCIVDCVFSLLMGVLTQTYLFICSLVLAEITLKDRSTVCEIQLGLSLNAR